VANAALPALATVADLADRLGLPEPTDPIVQVKWADALLDASSGIRDAIGQPITPGTATLPVPINEYGFGLIPISPVVGVTAVLDPTGSALPAEGTGYEVTDQRLTIYGQYLRVNPLAPTDPTYLVTVSHGWDPIPGELLRWVYVLAAAQIGSTAHGNLGINGGVESVAIDDGRVTYANLAEMIPDRVRARLRATYGGEQ
jgi:hypothetical protein